MTPPQPTDSSHVLVTPAGGVSNERELELMRRIVLRDRDAFRDLYLIYHRRVARFLMRMTSRHELVEEIINDTLWTVWQKAADFRGASRVSTWIVGIAYRRALKTLRQSGISRQMQSDEDMPEMAAANDTQSETENRQWLELALTQLPMEQRMVLEFAYLLGYSCEEIAQIMECPVNTVKTRMFHARQKLKVSLPQLATPNRLTGLAASTLKKSAQAQSTLTQSTLTQSSMVQSTLAAEMELSLPVRPDVTLSAASRSEILPPGGLKQ
ncbi:MAG TPA: sigma-70 family RNA polymerase sigma factor [Steroidobacteraceae bacterium]|jgi:RNA polymerase sigma-70 factor (ECF subfamily)